MKVLFILLLLFAVLGGVGTYALYLEQQPPKEVEETPAPPPPPPAPVPVVKEEAPPPAPVSYLGRRTLPNTVAVASSGSSSSSSVISVNGVQISVTEENGDVKITRTDAKNGTVVINPKTMTPDDDAEEISMPIIARDPKDVDKLERLVVKLWGMSKKRDKDWTDANVLEMRTLRRELVSLLSPKDVLRVKELRLRCDDWDIELGLADPLFAFTECEVKK